MEQLRLTVVDMQPIDPPIGGGRLRLLGLYSGFTNGLQATYVGTYDWRGPGFRDHILSPCLREINVPLSEEHFLAHDQLSERVGNGCIDTAFPLQGWLSKDYVSRAQEEIQKADIAVIVHPWVFPFVIPAVAEKRQLLVYDSQNMEALLKTKLLDDGSDEIDKVLREAVRAEYELCHAADVILVCSQEDKDNYVRFFHIPEDKMYIVPNGVFSSQIKPCDDVKYKEKLRHKLGLHSPTACFIGSAYYPNEEAARLIIEAAINMPDFQFVIIGGVGNSLDDIDLSLHKNVIITGFVEEHEKVEYLQASDIAINPMLSGSGTNIKMFDFMAAGLPIVTTKIGARGISNTNGNLYSICEPTCHDLRKKTIELYNDKVLSSTFRKNGLNEASDKYDWGRISERMGVLLAEKYHHKMNSKSRILMVSPYPPEKCGIGAYAYQQVQFLRKEGHHVDVFAISGNGKYRASLNNPEELNYLDAIAHQYDKIILQYHYVFYTPDISDKKQLIDMHRAFARLYNKHNFEIICHEVIYPIDYLDNVIEREQYILETKEKKEKWLNATNIVFHTETERNQFCDSLGVSPNESKLKVIPPSTYYEKFRDISQHEARKELGVPHDKKMFLCIGFIQPSKAFDQAAEAFARIENQPEKALYIVGSLRLEYDETFNYLNKLKAYDRNNENIILHEEFISNEEFDTWIAACDYVITPYREIWTSGILARASLFDKKAIVRDVGGLKEQKREDDVLFNDYEELYNIIADI